MVGKDRKKKRKGTEWHIFIDVRAVVICFYTTRRVRSIDVEGVEMAADRFDGAKVLRNCQGGSTAVIIL